MSAPSTFQSLMLLNFHKSPSHFHHLRFWWFILLKLAYPTASLFVSLSMYHVSPLTIFLWFDQSQLLDCYAAFANQLTISLYSGNYFEDWCSISNMKLFEASFGLSYSISYWNLHSPFLSIENKIAVVSCCAGLIYCSLSFMVLGWNSSSSFGAFYVPDQCYYFGSHG